MNEVSLRNEIIRLQNQNLKNRYRQHCCMDFSLKYHSDFIVDHLRGENKCQVSECGETNLQKHLIDCKKNPGHAQFIPVKTFSPSQLPEGHRDQDLYELIKATADLTVRVTVVAVSPRRPKFLPNTNVPYPFSNARSGVNTRLASGFLNVYKFTDGRRYDSIMGRAYEKTYQTCPCERCQSLHNASDVWWEIFVHTAAHAVFDDLEAESTICRLFYDEHDSPKVTLDKGKVHYVNISMDCCVLKYVTCDSALGGKLLKMAKRCDELWRRVDGKYMGRSDNSLNFIVSHPHGCAKHVSVGQWMDVDVVRECNQEWDMTKLVYNTSTCPGSSGARVFSVGFGSTHVHSGALDSRHNCSSIDYYKKK